VIKKSVRHSTSISLLTSFCASFCIFVLKRMINNVSFNQMKFRFICFKV
jgi:hypothetical protein